MATVDLSTFFVTILETTPIFKTRMEAKNDISIYQVPQTEDILESESHRDRAYRLHYCHVLAPSCRA